ncbi:quinate permease [Purpureocillium lavendulum]|uniref:Quinate permease n=1 Tax=Purpureocillium lavendulum TaxID=1247861 RepID=A0AB34FTJ2_9HYPO|nr:quinate permease [Purpureocillium lavendulum]
MGGFHAVEDRPTPKEVYNWRLYSEATIIATGSVLFGYDSAFIGTTIARKSFTESFSILKQDAADISSNITSAFQAGAFFGAIICFLVTEKVGRKVALQSSVLLFLVGAVLMVAATHQLSLIFPSYIAELSVASIRGILTGLFEVAYQIGTLVGFWINYGINQHMDVTSTASWRVPMAVQLIPAVFLLVGSFFLHESPLWLMRKDRDEDATKVLECLRKLPRSHKYIQEDMEMMRVRLREETNLARRFGHGYVAFLKGALFELSRRGMWNRVLLVFCAFALQNMSGAAAINYYSPTLFTSIGISDVALYTGIYGLVKAVASIAFYGLLIDKLGRRWPTIVSSVACSLCLWFVGSYVKVGHPADIIKAGKPLSASTTAGGKAATAMVMVYSVL